MIGRYSAVLVRRRFPLLVLLVGFAAAGCGSDQGRPVGSGSLTLIPGTAPPNLGSGNPAAGRKVFGAVGCGSCHTLAAASANGKVGTNLDTNPPGLDLVLDRVTNGQGGMPSYKDQLTKKQIDDVAAYVVAATH
jgi:mono/diheme cytochrome c family protein